MAKFALPDLEESAYLFTRQNALRGFSRNNQHCIDKQSLNQGDELNGYVLSACTRVETAIERSVFILILPVRVGVEIDFCPALSDKNSCRVVRTTHEYRIFDSIADKPSRCSRGGSRRHFLGRVFWTVRLPYRFRQLINAMEFVGVGSLFIVLLTGIFTGAVFALQGAGAFRMFNAESLVGSTVGLSLARELSPVLTGLMVTGRAGSGIATELGTMRVTEQIDALYTMAVNPVQYLVVPRFIAGLLMVPVLSGLFTLVGMVGCYFVGLSSSG